MSKAYIICAVTLAAVFAPGAAVQAQDPTVPTVEGELRAMVAQPSAADQDRHAIRAFLDREDVNAAAERHGVDLERLQRGVETLSADDAANLAERTRAAEDDLDQVGGDTLVISSTTIIIALLIIILVVVA